MSRQKIREAEVDREAVGYTDHIERPKRAGGGGFGLGLLFGVIIIAGAIMAFAYSQGSFQTAGQRADEAAHTAQSQIGQTTETAGDAAQNAGNQIENATDHAAN